MAVCLATGQGTLHAQSAPAGRALADALVELQGRGLKVLFSDRVVKPSMRVLVEPEAESLAQILDELLKPHGLEALRGSTGWLVVVRSTVQPGEPERRSEVSPATPQVARVSDVLVVTAGVQLPVHVLEGDEPVRGLQPGDFEVVVGGRRQEITGFQVVDLSLPDGRGDDPASGLPVEARRRFVVALDAGLESPASLRRAVALARELVTNGLHPADLLGVVTLSEMRRPQFALDFTVDRVAALSSIEALAGDGTSVVSSEPRIVNRSPHPSGGRHKAAGSSGDGSAPSMRKPSEGGRRDSFLDWTDEIEPGLLRADRQASLTRLLGLSDSMTELARWLRHAPGRKHVIFLSEGFDVSMLLGLGGASEPERQRIEKMNRAAEAGEIWRIDTDERHGNDAALTQFERMVGEFVDSHTVIHAVDIRLDEAGSATRRGQNGLELLAGRTGGGYVAVGGDLTTVLSTVSSRSSVTYLLSFVPHPREPVHRLRKLKVRLRRGLKGRVVYPRVLVPPSGLEQTPPA